MDIPRIAVLGLVLTIPLEISLFAPASAQSYRFTNFNVMGQYATINGISNSGVVVGYTQNQNYSYTNFKGTPGAFTLLNLGSPPNNGPLAFGINSSGQVVGQNSNGAFLLDSSNPAASPASLPQINGQIPSGAFGINDQGTIVGIYNDRSNGTNPGYVYANGTYTSFNPGGGRFGVYARAISNNGLVVGYYGGSVYNPFVGTHGFLFDTKANTTTLLADPVVSDLALVQLLGINDSGEAVGYYQTNAGVQHGFLYNTSTSAYTFLDDPNVAPGGSPTMQITGITNSGEITGFYGNSSGPLGFTAVPVPEVSSLVSLSVLLGLGLGGVCLAKRRTLTRH